MRIRKLTLLYLVLVAFFIPITAGAASLALSSSLAGDYDDEIVSSCPNLTQTLSYNRRLTNPASEVFRLQSFLTDHLNIQEDIIVGFFGKKTDFYVKQFQSTNGIGPTGVVGSITRAKIAEVCGGNSPVGLEVLRLYWKDKKFTPVSSVSKDLAQMVCNVAPYPHETCLWGATSLIPQVVKDGTYDSIAIRSPAVNEYLRRATDNLFAFNDPTAADSSDYRIFFVLYANSSTIGNVYEVPFRKLGRNGTFVNGNVDLSSLPNGNYYPGIVNVSTGVAGSVGAYVFLQGSSLPSSIEVVAPNGGERVQIGQPYQIKIRSAGISTFSVALYRDDRLMKWVQNSLVPISRDFPDDPNPSVYSWTPTASDLGAVNGLGQVFKVYAIGQKQDGTGYVDDKSDTPFSFLGESAALDTYRGYMGGRLFVTTPNITEAEALANCKLNASNNPGLSTRCTWGDKEIFSGAQTSTTPKTVYLVSGSSWSVPLDWNSVNNTVEVIGGGGGGMSGTAGVSAGTGGGGGAYSKVANLALSPGVSVTYNIGNAGGGGSGSGGSGGNGGDTYMCSSVTGCSSIGDNSVVVGARGGLGGVSMTSGATGGEVAGGVGTIRYAGGNGGGNVFNNGAGSGGGGAGGPFGKGADGGSWLGIPSNGGAPGGGGSSGGGAGGSTRNDASGSPSGAGGNNHAGFGGGASSTGAGTSGYAGGGGSGGSGAQGFAGTGGSGTDWDSSHGAGGGGGGAGTDGTTNHPGGDGGNYGGGGGGGSATASGYAMGGRGGPGIIVVTYTPMVSNSISRMDGNLDRRYFLSNIWHAFTGW